jgi:RNA polymerase sigma-70 factor, ECF subfamily
MLLMKKNFVSAGGDEMATLGMAYPDQAVILGDNDLELVREAKEGSITAFDELVRRHERQMFRIAHQMLHNREDAQDIVQDAFIKAFQKLSQFQAKSKFSTWLARITVNEALTKLRREPVYWKTVNDDAGSDSDEFPREIADWAPNPEMLFNDSEFRQILEKNLQRLAPGLRAVFLLRDVEEFSLEETAQSLGLTVAAVKIRSWRARLQLREWLTRYFSKGGSQRRTVLPYVS